MAEKSTDSWHLDDWNRALCQHYFAEGTDTTPVTRLAVTSEELSKATKNVIGPDEARKSLINLLRVTLAHRSLGSDAQKRAEQWEPIANVPPPFLTHLLFSCMVVGDVAEQLQSVGDFRGRLTKLLGWGSGHGLDKLPALWRLLRDWSNIQYERHGSVRRLVLPAPPAHLAIIGYQYSLAFPTRRDQERLRDILRAEGLVGAEPPVTRVFRVLENQLMRFTPQFQDTYQAFRDLYHVRTRSASAATAFWSVVREAALNVSLEPGHSRLPKLQLALEVDLDGYSLAIMSSREFSTKDFRTIPFPLGLKDYSFLVLKTDDEPIEAARPKLAYAVSDAANTTVERLQCYEGINEEKAIGKFDESLQRLCVELRAKSGDVDWASVRTELHSQDFFNAGPLMRALLSEKPCVLLVDELDKVDQAFETLSFRHIAVVNEEYAASNDGMKMFGVLDLETQMEGCRFSIGIRNSHDKSLRLGLTAGLRVFVCSNMAFSGDFTPMLAKHTKSFNLIDTLSVGVDRIQRNFEPLQRQVELWRKTQITDDTAKLIFYSAFIDGKLEAPRTLLPEVHRLYFEPQYPEFAARTMWSLSNAFTSAFKKLDPVPQFKATAKLGAFLAQLPN